MTGVESAFCCYVPHALPDIAFFALRSNESCTQKCFSSRFYTKLTDEGQEKQCGTPTHALHRQGKVVDPLDLNDKKPWRPTIVTKKKITLS